MSAEGFGDLRSLESEFSSRDEKDGLDVLGRGVDAVKGWDDE
jgi:hypothetical protein